MSCPAALGSVLIAVATARQVVCFVTPELLAEILMQGVLPPARIVKDAVPADAALVSAGYHGCMDMFYIVFEHESFEVVEAGHAIPTRKPLFERIA